MITFKICLAALALLAGLEVRAEDGDPYLNCDLLLSTPVADRARRALAERFAAGEAEDDVVVGYVGLSNREMLTLLNHGVLRPGGGFRPKLWAFFVADHPGLIPFTSIHPEFQTGAMRRDLQLGLAQTHAWARTVADLLAKRYPHANLASERVLDFLRALKEEVGGATRATFTQVRNAAEVSTLTKAGRGPDAKLLTLTKMFSLPWASPARRTSEMRLRLASVFSDLPVKTGVVLALDPSVLNGVNWSSRELPVLKRILVKDVVGVEPMDLTEFQFMDRVRRRAGVK